MKEKIRQIVDWLVDKKALDIQVVDVQGISPLTETLILVTAFSAKHAQALAEEQAMRCREQGWDFFGVEGVQTGQWILVDCNDVLVHIFQEESRALYSLESLYPADRVCQVQA